MFLDVDNSLSTRQSPAGAVVIRDTISVIDIMDTDLRRGPDNVATCSLYVGDAGAVDVTTADGDRLVINVQEDATFLPLQVRIVHAAGTAGDNIIGLY